MHRSCLSWHRALQTWGAASTLLEPSCFLLQTTLPGAACCGLLAPVTGGSIMGFPGHTAHWSPRLFSSQCLPWVLAHTCPCAWNGFLRSLLFVDISSGGQGSDLNVPSCDPLHQESAQMAIWKFTKTLGTNESECLVQSEPRPGRPSLGSLLGDLPAPVPRQVPDVLLLHGELGSPGSQPCRSSRAALSF